MDTSKWFVGAIDYCKPQVKNLVLKYTLRHGLSGMLQACKQIFAEENSIKEAHFTLYTCVL